MCYGQEISNALRRARKLHVCSWCSEKIEPKTKYFNWFGIVDGDPSNIKLHTECEEASEKFFASYPGECWTVGQHQRGEFDPDKY